MSEDPESLLRLLKTKHGLGLAGKPGSSPQDTDEPASSDLIAESPPALDGQHEFGPEDQDESGIPKVICINCGYIQQGQPIDRCPECSLPLAARLTDPTAWNCPKANIIDWWNTAKGVWGWDRRTRLRTSYIPINPASRRFAKWSLLMTAPCLGLAVAVVGQLPKGSVGLIAGYFLLIALIGTILSGLLLAGTLFGLTVALKGTWRMQLRFVPASVDYATAWWLPVAAAILLVSCIQVARGDSAAIGFRVFLPLGVFLWGLWLWGSATECQHVRHVGPRMAVVLLAFWVVGGAMLLSIPGQTRKAAIQALAFADSGLLRLNLFGTISANSASAGPQTYALFIANVPADDEPLILARLADLGAGASTRVKIHDSACTLAQIDKAFSAVQQDLTSQDRFILYINGRGASNGPGSIRVADGEITSRQLADRLRDLPTSHCLVVLDLPSGGKLLPALRNNCNATVLTWTDNPRVGPVLSLREFWKALRNPEYDRSMNGRVTVQEAFEGAYRDVLAETERAHEKALLKVSVLDDSVESTIDPGYTIPQLEVIGQGGVDDFGVPLPSQASP